MKPVIGILGGMGPRATVEFERLLVDKFSGSDQDIPMIVSVNDGGIPDRSDYLLGTGKDPMPKMVQNAQALQRMGADIICLPCNTACMPDILDRVQAQSPIPIINLPIEVGSVLSKKELSKVCLLATQGTLSAGIYQQICRQCQIDCVVPNNLDQRLVTRIIRAVKNNDLVLARLLAKKFSTKINNVGCDALILACTELPIVGNEITPNGCTAIDTLDVLADACVAYTKTIKLEEKVDDTRPIYA